MNEATLAGGYESAWMLLRRVVVRMSWRESFNATGLARSPNMEVAEIRGTFLGSL